MLQRKNIIQLAYEDIFDFPTLESAYILFLIYSQNEENKWMSCKMIDLFILIMCCLSLLLLVCCIFMLLLEQLCLMCLKIVGPVRSCCNILFFYCNINDFRFVWVVLTKSITCIPGWYMPLSSLTRVAQILSIWPKKSFVQCPGPAAVHLLRQLQVKSCHLMLLLCCTIMSNSVQVVLTIKWTTADIFLLMLLFLPCFPWFLWNV